MTPYYIHKDSYKHAEHTRRPEKLAARILGLVCGLILPEAEAPCLHAASRWAKVVRSRESGMRQTSRNACLLRVEHLHDQALLRLHLREVMPFVLTRIVRWSDLPHLVLWRCRRPLHRNEVNSVVKLFFSDGASITQTQWLVVHLLKRTPDVSDGPAGLLHLLGLLGAHVEIEPLPGSGV